VNVKLSSTSRFFRLRKSEPGSGGG
jgi:hypothetical protein